MKKIYLAGPIKDCSEKQKSGWRDFVTEKLTGVYEIYDPVKFEWDEIISKEKVETLEEDASKMIVETDLEYIKKCDVVLAGVWKFSAGTMMELVYATRFNKIIFVICPNELRGPWIKYHSTKLFDSLTSAIETLKEMK
jgi:nucleoside 2-deoxyribosyltransferase